MTGYVMDVIDGDQIVVRDYCRQMLTVRLVGIDAPEKESEKAFSAKRNLWQDENPYSPWGFRYEEKKKQGLIEEAFAEIE